MPINQSIFNFEDDLEKRIKNICFDPHPKTSIRRIYCEDNQKIGMIYSGAKFSGFQSSNGGMGTGDDQKYEVTVEVQNVDSINSLITGYLNISNLTTVRIINSSENILYFIVLGISGADNFF